MNGWVIKSLKSKLSGLKLEKISFGLGPGQNKNFISNWNELGPKFQFLFWAGLAEIFTFTLGWVGFRMQPCRLDSGPGLKNMNQADL